MANDGNAWASYRTQLTKALGIDDASSYRDATSFCAADWEVLDTTGLPGPAEDPVSALQSKYDWSDAMPVLQATNYLRGSGLHDMYGMFLRSLQSSVAGVDAALAKLDAITMSAGLPPTSYPAYEIRPGLADWYKSALQSVASARPAALDLEVRYSAPRMLARRAPAPTVSAPVGATPPFVSYAPAIAARNAAFSTVRATASSSPSAANLELSNVDAQEVTFHFKAQSVQTFNVTVGAWYSPSMLLYDRFIRADSPMAGRTLFGADGLLNLRTAQIVVALGRSLVVRTSSEHATAVRAAARDGGQLAIGGFAFGLTSDQTRVDSADSEPVVTLSDNLTQPYVIGVVVEQLDPARGRPA